jgi:hypothetical protein
MQLPEFISKALAFFQKAEANLTAEQELGKARLELKTVSDKATADIAALNSTIKDLQATVTTHETSIKAKDTIITTLKAAVETEKKKANAVIAGQGVPADAVPEATATEGETPWMKYQRLMATDPRAAGQYYLDNADKVLASRK